MSPCIQIQGPLRKAFGKRCEAVLYMCACGGFSTCNSRKWPTFQVCKGPPGGSPKAELSPSAERSLEGWLIANVAGEELRSPWNATESL